MGTPALSRGTRWLIALAIVAFVLTPVIASAATVHKTASGNQAAQPSRGTTGSIALAGLIVVPIVFLAGIAAGTVRRRRRTATEPSTDWRTAEPITTSGPNTDWRATARVITNSAPEPVPAVTFQRSTTWA